MNKDWQKQLDKWARRKAKFKALLSKGWTYREIAEREGRSTQCIYQIVNRKKKNDPENSGI